MKTQLDDLGRIRIPKEIRRNMSLQCKDMFDIISLNNNSILITRINDNDKVNISESILTFSDNIVKEIYEIVNKLKQSSYTYQDKYQLLNEMQISLNQIKTFENKWSEICSKLFYDL